MVIIIIIKFITVIDLLYSFIIFIIDLFILRLHWY